MVYSRGVTEQRHNSPIPVQVRLRFWPWPITITLCIALASILLHLLWWVFLIARMGGPEQYVRGFTDFMATLTGGQILREGRGPRLYDLAAQRLAQERVLAPYFTLGADHLLPYNHPPLEALLTAPFMNFPYSYAFLLWTITALGAIGLALRLLLQAAPIPTHQRWALMLAACSYHPLHAALWTGQNTPFVLLGLCGTYASVKAEQPKRAGLWLLLVALKPQLLPLILVFLVLLRQWKALTTFGGALGGLSIAAMPILGFNWPLRYVQFVSEVSHWASNKSVYPDVMPTWRGCGINLFEAWLPGAVTPFFVAMSAASLGILLWGWWYISGATSVVQPIDSAHHDLLWAIAVVVAILTALHLNPHDLAILIVPAWIVVSFVTSAPWVGRGVRWWYGLLWLGYLLAPLQMYQMEHAGVAVLPSVLVMTIALFALVWQTRSTPVPLASLPTNVT